MMQLYVAVAAVALWSLVSAGCSSSSPQPGPGAGSSTESRAVSGTSSRIRIHPKLPEFTVTLIGQGMAEQGGIMRVASIEIRQGSATAPAQIIDGLETETPILPGEPILGVLDMNFDGYSDLRLVEFQPAGPNVPYLNWLFDPASGRFVESTALNEITAPKFDAAAHEIRSDWRDGASRYGTDIYAYKDGVLVPVRRELREFDGPDRYTDQVLKYADGVWIVVEQSTGSVRQD